VLVYIRVHTAASDNIFSIYLYGSMSNRKLNWIIILLSIGHKIYNDLQLQAQVYLPIADGIDRVWSTQNARYVALIS
jgi:hypothetical protein